MKTLICECDTEGGECVSYCAWLIRPAYTDIHCVCKVDEHVTRLVLATGDVKASGDGVLLLPTQDKVPRLLIWI